MGRVAAAAIGLCLLGPTLCGCTTYRDTQPAATATQQLLEAHAAELAAANLAAALPVRSAVYIDASHFKGDGSDYALSAIHAALLRRGLSLVREQKDSKVTVELRMGALSIDRKDTVIGVPTMTLPIPGTITAVPIPELSLYSASRSYGKAEFAALAYDTASGGLVALAGPVGGERQLVERRYLTFIVIGARLEPAGVIDRR